MSSEAIPGNDVKPGGIKWAVRASWAAGFLFLAGLILVVLKFGELRSFLKIAERAHPGWILVAVGLQALTYVSAAAAWRVPLKRSGHRISLFRMVPLGMAKLFTDQAFPSGGMSGNLLVARGLGRRGVPSNLVMAAFLVGIIGYYVAYLLLVLAALGILWFHHQVHPAFLVALAFFSAVAVAIPTAVLWLKRRSNRPLPRFLNRFHGSAFLRKALLEVPASILRDPVVIVETTFFEAGVFLLDAATLWMVLLAIGQHTSPTVAFTSLMAASVAATIGPIPLGLGTFEATAVATFGLLGIPIETGLTAVLLFRGLSFWLPMVPGMLLARREVGGT